MLMAMYYAMGILAFWLEDNALSKFCKTHIHNNAKGQLRLHAPIFLLSSHCRLGDMKEVKALLDSFMKDKLAEQSNDFRYAIALAFCYMRDFARAADVAEKLDDAMDVLPLRVFIALSRGQPELAASIVRRSAPLNQLKDPLFVDYEW